MKQDNRGLTLIELIIAVAVSSIIFGATLLFIRNSLRSYEAATKTIDLQMESHVMMEQVGAWIMEGNRIEVVDGVTVELIQSNGSITDKSVDKVLVIYQIPRTIDTARLPDGLTIDTNGNLTKDVTPGASPAPITASKRLIWSMDNKLYTRVIDSIENYDADTTTVVSDVDEWGHCICEFLETFEPSWDSDKNTVKVEVKLKAGDQEYQLKNEFKVRNEIMPTPSPTP